MKEIAPAVCCLPTSFVNAYLVGEARAPWVLVDTGLPGFAWKIRAAARERFVEPTITDESGVVRLPPKPSDPVPLIAAGLCAGAALGCWVGRRRR